MILPVFFTLLSILISHSSAITVSDFCVADLSLPNGPAGYGCKDPKTVTVDDFVYVGLAVPSDTTNIYNSSINALTAAEYPGLNGMGIAVALGHLNVGGMSSFHTHHVSEVLLVVEGTIVAGFMDANDRAYYKTLNKGDVIVFPHTLLHFYLNAGSTPAVTYAAFASEIPGSQRVINSFFGGNLPSDYVQKVGLIDDVHQVQKLKKLFGGTN